jgi:hypothetical protein
MKKLKGFLGGLAAFIFLVLMFQNLAANGDATAMGNGTIEVGGFGKVSVEPDEGHVIVSVEVEAAKASDAASKNAEIVNKVIAKIKATGVENIKTKSYRVEPIYQWVEKPIEPIESIPYESSKGGVVKRSEIVGYRAYTSLEVVAHPEMVGKVIDAAMEGGANRIDSVFFTLSEDARKDAYEVALRKAVGDAKNKAEVVAEELGIENYRIAKVTVGYGYIPAPVYEVKAVSAQTTIIPSEVEVSATVNLIYEFS